MDKIPLCTYTVTLYAPSEHISDPSGAGVTDLEELFSKSREGVQEKLQESIREFAQSDDWKNLGLSVNVQQIQ